VNTWQLTVTNTDSEGNELGDWNRSLQFQAVTLEDAVTRMKDKYLLWPFGQVQENVGGDEGTFIWREGKMLAWLSFLEG
jgi:hypothetical protein